MPNLFLEFRWSDAVDIVFVAALAYFGMVWLRRTRAAMVAGGLLILAAVYVAARAFGLQLTAWLFQGFFAIFLVIVVVIFQEELRQLFERVALFSLGRTERPASSGGTVQVLVQALSDCARDHVGALVVLPGRQPISRHVRGGIPLDGLISVPLIKSVFDHHSPGHDGALVIDKGRASEFAVHLPLSTNFDQLAGVGTRHSAALGLAERTDALCLAVSEERGTISVAQAGTLTTLTTPHELTVAIERFLGPVEPAAPRWRSVVRMMRENWLEKLAAVAVVLGLWYVLVPGSRPSQATFPVRVELMNIPAELSVDEIVPEFVDVTVSGPARAFYLFDPKRLRIRLNIALAAAGRRTFQVTEQDVAVPKEFTVDMVAPGRVKLSLKRAGG